MELSIIFHFSYIGFGLKEMLNKMQYLILEVFNERKIDFFKNNKNLSGYSTLEKTYSNLSSLSNPESITSDLCNVEKLHEDDTKYCKYFKNNIKIKRHYFHTYSWIIATIFIFVISIIQNNIKDDIVAKHIILNNTLAIIFFILLICSIGRAIYLMHSIKEVELTLLRPDGVLKKLSAIYNNAYDKLKKEIEDTELLAKKASTEEYNNG